MNHAVTIAALIMASITFYVGGAHLLLCRKHLGRRHHALFSLSCFAFALYALYSAGLYHATSVNEGMIWQRAQLSSVCMAAALVIWFVHDYSFRRHKRTIYVFFVYFLTAGAVSYFAPDHWLFTGETAIRTVTLFDRYTITYQEAELGGPFIVQSVMGVWAGIYVCIIIIQGLMRHDRHKYATLLLAMFVFLAGVMNDVGNSVGFWNTIYLTEYAFLAIVVLMSVQLADEIALAVSARERLRTIEQQFLTVFKNAAVGIGLIDEHKTLVTANTALCGMLGRAQWEIQGTPVLECIHPSDAPQVSEACDDMLRGDLEAFREEMRYIQPTDRDYWGDMSLALVRGTGTHETGLLWIVVGVTERRRAVKALKRLNEELENEVGKRTAQLEQSNRKLAHSLQVLEDDERAGRMMQFSLLPPESRVMGPYRFERYLAPSLYLSGDFPNFFWIDADHIGFYVADVAGHGVPSAFVTLLLDSQVKNALENFKTDQDRTILDPSRLVARLNEALVRHEGGKHVTFFYAVINVSENTLVYTNGGQFPPPVIRYAEEEGTFAADTFNLPGTAVGLFDFATFTNSTVRLPEAFVLVVFSDGILEIMPQDSLTEKLDALQSMIDRPDMSLADVVARSGVDKLESLPDDVTILMVRRGGHGTG